MTTPANVTSNLPPRRRLSSRPRDRLVGRMDSDIPLVAKFSCAIHQVSFYGPKESPGLCPVCDRDAMIDRLLIERRELATELEISLQSTQRLSVQVNELDAMRKALEAINVDDLTFIKSILYRWKIDETCLTLIACKDAEDQWQFLARVKKSGPNRIGEQHTCTSLGGIVLAASFEQAVKVTGTQNATRMMLRAVSQHLANVEADEADE